MPVSFLIAWVTISMLYISTGIFSAVVWRDDLPDVVWLALLATGGLIFISVNQRIIIGMPYVAIEAVLLFIATVLWLYACLTILMFVNYHRRLETSSTHDA